MILVITFNLTPILLELRERCVDSILGFYDVKPLPQQENCLYQLNNCFFIGLYYYETGGSGGGDGNFLFY